MSGKEPVGSGRKRVVSSSPLGLNTLWFLKHGASLLLSLFLESVLWPSACHVPLAWVHLQANCYELPDILYKASGVCVLGAVRCWWRWWWSVSLEWVIAKPPMANSVHLQKLTRASCVTEDRVLALRRRWWSPSPQPCRTWCRDHPGLQSRPLMKKMPVILHHCLLFLCVHLQVLINVLIGNNVSEFLCITCLISLWKDFPGIPEVWLLFHQKR